LAMRMVADVTETRNVIPSLEFKTCMTNDHYVIKELFNGPVLAKAQHVFSQPTLNAFMTKGRDA